MCPKSQRLNSSPMHWEWSVFRSWCLGHISDRWSPSSLVNLADLLTSWFHLQEHRSKDHVETVSKPSLQFFAIYKSPITMLQCEDCGNYWLGPHEFFSTSKNIKVRDQCILYILLQNPFLVKISKFFLPDDALHFLRGSSIYHTLYVRAWRWSKSHTLFLSS